MDVVDPRLVAALTRQLEARGRALADGARRVGWKLGVGDAERIGAGPVVGHLTSATQLEPGGIFRAGDVAALHADVEIAVELAADLGPGDDVRGAIGGYAAALELVDLESIDRDPEAIVAANVFHCAFALGATVPPIVLDRVVGRLVVDGETRDEAPAEDVDDRLAAAARIVAAGGDGLLAGDRIITGSIVQVPVAPGSRVVADLGPLGSVGLEIG
jgi:2-keto-4-pentenoate hydratase